MGDYPWDAFFFWEKPTSSKGRIILRDFPYDTTLMVLIFLKAKHLGNGPKKKPGE